MLRRTIKVAVLAATIMGSVAVASPAVAGADVIVTPPELKPPEGVGYQEKCIVVSNPDGPEQSTVCIIEDGKAHSATVDYLGRQNVSISWRVWMDQCRGDGTNCSTVTRSFMRADTGSSPSMMSARLRTISASAQYVTPSP